MSLGEPMTSGELKTFYTTQKSWSIVVIITSSVLIISPIYEQVGERVFNVRLDEDGWGIPQFFLITTNIKTFLYAPPQPRIAFYTIFIISSLKLKYIWLC